MFEWLRKKVRKLRGREESDVLGFGSVPDPGLASFNVMRQWLGIYQQMDKSARERGGSAAERPADERMLYVARGLMRYNPFAQGFISSLRTHVLGANGLVHNAVGPSAKVVNSFLKMWKDETDWWSREREIYERVHIEGEAVPRYFLSDGCVEMRMIEPEWIVAPDGSKEWTYGFYNEPGDVEQVTALWALYGDEGGEQVDWGDWYHVKSKLTVRAEKRGRSDFLAVAALLDNSFKVWRNFLQSEAVRQAIIYFAEQAPGVTADDLDQVVAADADYSPPASASGRTGTPVKLVEGSGVEYLQAGCKLASAPAAENIQGVMTGVNAGLLAVGRPYNMPLVLISGDMSANNTLDFGDESPFGTAVGDEQNWYCRHVRNILWRVVELAAEESDALATALDDGTNLEVTSERKPARDAEKNTSRGKTLYDDGVISGRERSAMEGVDYDEQQAQRQREGLPRMGQQPAAPPMAGLEEGGELVEKEVTVHRDGKTFQQTRKVKAHPITKSEGDKKLLQKLAEKAPNSAAKEAVLDAEWNVRKAENFDNDEDRRRHTVERIGAAWRDAQERGDKDGSDYLEHVMAHFGAELSGPKPGETVEFNGRYYTSDKSVASGPVKVIRQPVIVKGADWVHVATQGKVAPLEARESAGEGLVEKQITVHRDGKTFTETRMVRPHEAETEKEKGSDSTPKLEDGAAPDKAALEKHKASLTPLQAKAVKGYTEWDWEGVRNRIATGKMTDSDKAFMEALQTAPVHEGPMYRGFNDGQDPVAEARFQKAVEQLLALGEGGTWEDAAPASHSREVETAVGFSTAASSTGPCIMFQVHSKTGRCIEHLAGLEQQEVVAMPGTKYTIKSVQENVEIKGVTHRLLVVLEEK